MFTVIVTLPTEDIKMEIRSYNNVMMVVARLIESYHMDNMLLDFLWSDDEIFEYENVTVIKPHDTPNHTNMKH